MKKIFRMIRRFAVCLLVLVSCVRETYQSATMMGSDGLSFTATHADNDATRTLRADDGSVLWSPGDNFHLFYGSYSSRFESSITTPSASASFHGSLDGFVYNNTDPFWALYPYSDADVFDGNYFTLSLPHSQRVKAGSFETGIFPAVARSHTFELGFRNVCGGVKFCLSKSGVTKVTFKGNLSEPVAGKVKVGLNLDGIPMVSEFVEAKSEISLSAPAGSTLETGKWYYLVAFPASLLKGYTMTLVYEDNHREIVRSENPVEIKRSTFGTLTNVNNKVTDTQNPAGGTRSGLYLGITGFNKALYYYPIRLLDESSLGGFHGFIDDLQQEHMTLLYYSVKDAIRTLQVANYPSDLFSASIVTFTDGEDDGSVYYEKYPGTDEGYLSDVNQRLNEEEVAGIPLNAWTVGLQSADASNSALFLEHLRKLSRPEENGVRVTNMSEVNSAFEKIAKDLNQSFYIYNISIRMVGKPHGTKVRFTLDNVSSADHSSKYVEGSFDMYNACLYDVTYHGFDCSSGYRVQGADSDGMITFRFENIRTDDNTQINSAWFKQWGWNTSTGSWHPYSEFDPAQDSYVEKVKKSAVVLLNLDSTTSLSSGSTDLFPTLKAYAKDFVTRLWEYSLDSQTAVYSVTLDQTSLELTDGGTATLSVTIRPSTALNKTVTWSSSNTDVATVSSSGKVTAKKPGKAIITVRTSDGNKIAQCTVNVTKSGVQAVDLGLSVQWASFNLGATRPEGYGDYYAWGETSTKSEYDWNTYKFYTGTNASNDAMFSKYNTMIEYGPVDNKSILDMEDDAARINWGDPWRMPTREEFDELINNCSAVWTTLNNVRGYRVTSKINGNSIFFPATGYRNGYSKEEVGTMADYLSSSLDSDSWPVTMNYNLRLRSDGFWTTNYFRYSGNPVRPVYGYPVPLSGISLNKASLTLDVNNVERLTVTVRPDHATNKYIHWESSNTSVASVDPRGVITANMVGSATITATSVDGGKTARCEVTVTDHPRMPQAVDLGLQVKWASWNVGAAAPDGSGFYFAWGETAPKRFYTLDNYKFRSGGTTYSNITFFKYNTIGNYGTIDNRIRLLQEDDAASVILGGGWRMPTKDEVDEFMAKCSFSSEVLNGVAGFRATSQVNGNSIFLPIAGFRIDSRVMDYRDGPSFWFWSSSLREDDPRCAYNLSFPSVYNGGSIVRYWGFPVRPVMD